ncbi:SDR family oxidoreductase [Streptomyces mirabilis]|uniref:SDR family oxidoreductase n=1 Tax=Streptomyces mirabilis TaxID=68239 RepID=UPI0036C294BB
MSEGADTHPTPSGSSPPSPPTVAGRAGAAHELGTRRADRLVLLTKELSAAGHSAEYAELDVTHPSGVHASAEGALACHRRIDVLVNNAGVMPPAPLAALCVAEWHQMIDVNLWGVLHGIAAVLPSMLELRSGHVVTIASTAAQRVDPTAAVYCATKYALRALSEGLHFVVAGGGTPTVWSFHRVRNSSDTSSSS